MNHELLMALCILIVVLLLGLAVGKVVGLHGRQELIPTASGVGLYLLYNFGMNLVEVYKAKKRK